MNTAVHSIVARITSAIEPPSEQWHARAREYLDTLTKPIGSLGMLEDIAAQMVQSGKLRHEIMPLRAVLRAI